MTSTTGGDQAGNPAPQPAASRPPAGRRQAGWARGEPGEGGERLRAEERHREQDDKDQDQQDRDGDEPADRNRSAEGSELNSAASSPSLPQRFMMSRGSSSAAVRPVRTACQYAAAHALPGLKVRPQLSSWCGWTTKVSVSLATSGSTAFGASAR
jgi:hypothetical protein